MATLSELTVQVLTARLTKKEMSLEELQKEILTISSMLKSIDEGTTQEPPTVSPVEDPKPKKIDFKKVFKKDEVVCLICNKGFKTLKKHLTQAHQLTDKEYKSQFGIPKKQALVAKSYSDQKKAFALENKLGDKMLAGRKAQLEAAVDITDTKVKALVPDKRVKPAVPAKTTKK